MTRRRFASAIAGAAGLIAVTTLFARMAGFARILVFADAVRTGGVGGIYQTVNAVPNVLFEIVAGGILAAVAVPLIAQPARRRPARPRRPHGIRAADRGPCCCWCRWRPCSGCWPRRSRRGSWSPTTRAPPRSPPPCCGSSPCRCRSTAWASSSPALLQAHRRFLAAALAPLASSIVVLTSYLWYALARRRPGRPVARQRRGGRGCSAGARRSASSCCRCRSSCPPCAPAGAGAPRCGCPPSDARRIGALAGAGVVALLAQQAAVVATMWLSKQSGDDGTFAVYRYACRRCTSCRTPCSPCRWRRAPSRPAGRPHRGRGGRHRHPGPLAASGARRSRRCRCGGAHRRGPGRSGRSSRCSTPGTATAPRAPPPWRPCPRP